MLLVLVAGWSCEQVLVVVLYNVVELLVLLLLALLVLVLALQHFVALVMLVLMLALLALLVLPRAAGSAGARGAAVGCQAACHHWRGIRNRTDLWAQCVHHNVAQWAATKRTPPWHEARALLKNQY